MSMSCQCQDCSVGAGASSFPKVWAVAYLGHPGRLREAGFLHLSSACDGDSSTHGELFAWLS